MIKVGNQIIELVQDGLQWGGSKDTVARSLSFSIVYQPMDNNLPAYQVKKGEIIFIIIYRTIIFSVISVIFSNFHSILGYKRIIWIITSIRKFYIYFII